MKFISRVIYAWGVRSFGEEHMKNKRMRALRILEEAIELAQACGVPVEKAHDVVVIVYGRPIGNIEQEIGGTFVTLHALCYAQNLDPDLMLENEVARCLAKTPEHFAKRNQEKIDLGLI